MRVFHVAPEQFVELPGLPEQLPASGFIWIGSAQRDFEVAQGQVQQALLRWTGTQLVDLHISDLLNPQLPSHYDFTSWYDLLVFRRLTASAASAAVAGGKGGQVEEKQSTLVSAKQTLDAVDTSPVGFAVFDRVLLTVHPADCAVREHFAHRLAGWSNGGDARGNARLPANPADLMLRMVNHMVDSYLELRRLLTRQLGTLQQALLDPKSRFSDWRLLLEARTALHLLEDACEDQRAAVQEFIDAMAVWPVETDADKRREHELLSVRSRDVLEHVERVLSHVRRLEQSAETAVQLHFSALGHRTNDIMRTLTVLTAVFLPLNLITGFFGMNFEFMPLIHTSVGFWIAVVLMFAIGSGLVWFFWRKRYLAAKPR